MKKKKYSIKDKFYHWALFKLPHRIMWYKYWWCSKYFTWEPRWGYSKQMIDSAKEEADELYESIKWE